MTGSADRTSCVLELKKNTVVNRMQIGSGITCLQLSSNSEMAVYGCINGELQNWFLKTFQRIYKIAAHSREIDHMVIHQEEVVTAGADRKVNVFHLSDGKLLFTLQPNHSLSITTLLLNERHIVSGSRYFSVEKKKKN